MSVEENKAIERRITEELFNKGNLTVVDELFAANYVDYCALPGIAPDREGLKQFVTMSRTALPDFHSTIEDMIAEGDKVVTRFTVCGTQKGEFLGIAATGKQVMVMGIAIHRISGGKIVENWLSMDMLGVLQQLGVVPPLGQPSK